MGLDYTYEIFIPSGNVAKALVELAYLAPPRNSGTPLQVTLPGGERLALPFTSHFKSDPVEASADGTLDLDTSILMPVDDVMRACYLWTDRECDALGRTAIGYIYLTVRFASWRHPDFAVLEFTAATTGMSKMFELSPNTRRVFTDLTAASGGVCCLLDKETEVFDVCWLDGEPVRDTVPGPRFASFEDLVATWRSDVE
jgi:hypothetical protein